MDNSCNVENENEDKDDHYIAFMNNNLFVLPNDKDVLDDLSFIFDSSNDNSKIDTKLDNINNNKTDYNNFYDKDEIGIAFISDVITPDQLLFSFPDGRDVLDDPLFTLESLSMPYYVDANNEDGHINGHLKIDSKKRTIVITKDVF